MTGNCRVRFRGEGAAATLSSLPGDATWIAGLLGHGLLRAKIPQLEQALAGRFGPHQRFLVAQHRAHSDLRDDASARWSAEVAQRLAPFADQSARSDTVPGRNERAIEGVLAESGTAR